MLRALWNSNLIFSKGCLLAIDGCISAFENGLDVSITVLGRPLGDDVYSKEAIGEEVSLRAKQACVDYVGLVSLTQAHTLAALSDVVLLPSSYRSECQPLALISAMVNGCEVVVCDTPALRATLGSYPAWFVEENVSDVVIVLSKIAEKKLVTDESIELARRRFSRSRFFEEMSNVLC